MSLDHLNDLHTLETAAIPPPPLLASTVEPEPEAQPEEKSLSYMSYSVGINSITNCFISSGICIGGTQ